MTDASTTQPLESRPLLRIGHSPDPDDAFMWFPLTGIDGGPPLIDTGRFRFEAVQQDIETLNQRSEIGDLEITAISMAQFPFVAQTYALTCCGASLGNGYGPKIVAKQPVSDVASFLRDPTTQIAIPGKRTSARLATALMIGTTAFNAIEIPFEEIIDAVAAGTCDAGVVIHEGQLTYAHAGLTLLTDLGEWWMNETNLPLPLGANTIRRDLETIHGPGTLEEITSLLFQSISYALDHRDEAIDYALRFGRGVDRALADEFVTMYVNTQTLHLGERGQQGVRRFLTDAGDAGFVPDASKYLECIETTGNF